MGAFDRQKCIHFKFQHRPRITQRCSFSVLFIMQSFKKYLFVNNKRAFIKHLH